MYKITWTLPKAVYGTTGAVLSFTQDIQTAMLGLLICMTADTVTGLIAAPYRNQRRNSASLRQLVPKMISYFSAGLLAHICEVWVLPIWIGKIELARIVFSVFAAIEIMSCFENLKDITGFRAFDILTLNFKKQMQEKVGIELPPEETAK